MSGHVQMVRYILGIVCPPSKRLALQGTQSSKGKNTIQDYPNYSSGLSFTKLGTEASTLLFICIHLTFSHGTSPLCGYVRIQEVSGLNLATKIGYPD
jgi:hypothetical protein